MLKLKRAEGRGLRPFASSFFNVKNCRICDVVYATSFFYAFFEEAEMFIPYNPNPKELNVGDCTIRALSKVLDQSWEETYIHIAVQGLIMADMPSSDAVWGMYLKEQGFHKEAVEACMVSDYAKGNRGRCVLKLSGHVVALVDEDWYDTSDSGKGYILYVWRADA